MMLSIYAICCKKKNCCRRLHLVTKQMLKVQLKDGFLLRILVHISLSIFSANQALEPKFFRKIGWLLALLSHCLNYSILHLDLLSFFTKTIFKRPSETANLHQDNGSQYGYCYKQRYLQSWVSAYSS